MGTDPTVELADSEEAATAVDYLTWLIVGRAAKSRRHVPPRPRGTGADYGVEAARCADGPEVGRHRLPPIRTLLQASTSEQSELSLPRTERQLAQ